MILAVDLGSTNFKAALFAFNGVRVSVSSNPLPYSIRTNDRSELDPESVERCFLGLIEETVANAGASLGDIRKISFTSQAQTFCICDSDGVPASPYFGWTDARATAEAAELQAMLGKEFHQTTGFASVSPLLTLSKVLWWKRQHGLAPDSRVVLLPSRLAMSLGARQATDKNLAAMSGMYSIPENGWWKAALESVGVAPDQLGDVVSSGEAMATSRKSRPSGFGKDLEIVFAGNDHTAGAVACECEKGRPILTLGTAGVLYRFAGQMPGPYSAGGLWGPYPRGGYYELLCLDHACSALDWADHFLFARLDSPRFVSIAQMVQVTEKLPLFDPRRWGDGLAWVGEGTREAKAYAVLEGIAFALRDLAGRYFLANDGGMTILGGGSRLDFWAQLVADVFGQPLIRGSRDGLDGAALMAGVPVVAKTKDIELCCTNTAAGPILERRFARWQNLFAAAK